MYCKNIKSFFLVSTFLTPCQTLSLLEAGTTMCTEDVEICNLLIISSKLSEISGVVATEV